MAEIPFDGTGTLTQNLLEKTMTTIYHFFNAQTVHHVPKFIRSFNHFHRETQSSGVFVVFNFSEEYEPEYQKLESELRIEVMRVYSRFQMLTFFLKHSLNPGSTFILHGFNHPYFIASLFLPFRKNKVLWSNWGTGLNSHNGLRGVVHNTARRILYSRLDRINTLMAPDAEYLRNELGFKKEIVINPYSNFGLYQDRELGNTKRYFVDDRINILIGNHAGKINNHVKWLAELRRFRDEHIRIIIFAGYFNEDKEYVDEFTRYGKELYGAKFHVFESLLDMNTYMSVMKSVDVLIIDSVYQVGLAAIHSAAFFGGNIYLANEGRNELWMQERGIVTFKTRDITSTRSVKELLRLSEDERRSNSEIIRVHWQADNYNQRWYDFLYDK